MNNLSGSCRYIGSGPFAIVPTALLDANNASSFLPIALNLRARARVQVHRLTQELSIVARTNDWDESDTPAGHEIEPVIASVLGSADTRVAASQADTRLYIAAGSADNLLFANQYSAPGPDDTLYYILSVYLHLGLDAATVPLTAMQGIDAHILGRNIGHVKTAK